MTRLLAFGDLHLGSGPDFRLSDQEKVLLRIHELAIGEQVDGILFSGDAFHRRRPSPEEMRVWRDFVMALPRPMLAIGGNHDEIHPDLATAFELPFAPHYTPCRRPTVTTACIPGVSVACLPWTPPGYLVASRNGGDRDVLHEDVSELLLRTAADLRAECPDDRPAILLAHWSVSGASLPNGLPVDDLREPVIPLVGLDELGFDYIVLGHIHNAEVLPGNGHYFYTGSAACADWGEARVPHGAWLIETGEKPRLFSVHDRSFVTVDLNALDSKQDYVADGALVRVRGDVSADAARSLDEGVLRRALMDAGAHEVTFQISVEREDRARVAGVDETLGPMEALAMYCEAQDVPRARREHMADKLAVYMEAA